MLVRTDASSTTLTPDRRTASRRRRKRIGSSSLGSGPRSSTVPPAVQASSIVARGSPNTASAGSPSPIWASTLSEPITPLASLTQAYAASLVRRAPPSTAKPSGPLRSTPARIAAAARLMASPQVEGLRMRPSSRTSGPPRRSSLLTASKSKRPLSHIQPQLTASTSTPR